MTTIKKSSDFRGKSRCNILRSHEGLMFESTKNENYDKAIVAKEIIRGYFAGEYKTSEFADLVSQGLGVDDVISSPARDKKRDALVRIIKRYVLSETRKLKLASKQTIVYKDQEITVKPDFIYDDGYGLEVIMIRPGKPTITQTGKKTDASVDSCLELFFMVLYGRMMIPKGETRMVKASYYFLRKNTDRTMGMWDNDFFSGDGGNVVTLEDDAYIGGSSDRTSLDIKFEPQYEEFLKGTDHCSEEDCNSCAFKTACRYQKSPDVYEKRTNGKKNGKITPSEAQQKIIDFRKGVCRVNATAGSGKTECMTERGAAMLEEGVKPSEILFITFTEAGAYEMKERIVKKCKARNLPYTAEDINAMTFHKFAYKAIQEKYTELGYEKCPSIIDDVNKYVVIAQIMEDHGAISGLDYNNFNVNMPTCRGALACVNKVFDVIKENDIDITDPDAENVVTDELCDDGWYRFFSNGAISECIALYDEFNTRIREENLATFADLENGLTKILADDPDYFNEWGFKHIIVDEFQDTSSTQMNVVKHLISTPSFESLMVVGDDSQSIYSFRNTSQENILNFFDIIGMKGEDLFLTENRRSTPEILELANKINDLNTEKVDKEMVAVRESGTKPAVYGFFGKKAEYEFIAENIKHTIEKGEYLPEDIAFIAMKRSELITLASELSKRDIPWVMKNPMPLSENSRVQAALSLAEAFYQPEAENLYFNYLVAKYDGEIFNVPESDIRAEVAVMREQFENIDMLDIAYQQKIFHDMLDAIKGTDEIYEYFLSLVYEKEDFQSELEYMHNFTIFGENVAKKMEQSYEGVVLTTAHSSKGLEWPVVFLSVSNFDSKRLHRTSKRTRSRVEEMRRLLFVAITRARDYLCVSGQYVAYGSKTDKEEGQVYNQFLKEIFDAMDANYDPVDHLADIKDELKRDAKRKNKMLTPDQVKAYEDFCKNAEQLSFVW